MSISPLDVKPSQAFVFPFVIGESEFIVEKVICQNLICYREPVVLLIFFSSFLLTQKEELGGE